VADGLPFNIQRFTSDSEYRIACEEIGRASGNQRVLVSCSSPRLCAGMSGTSPVLGQSEQPANHERAETGATPKPAYAPACAIEPIWRDREGVAPVSARSPSGLRRRHAATA
jgi:hypothetical protein